MNMLSEYEKAAMDVVGRRFGKLLVLRHAPRHRKQPMVAVRCDCGTEKSVRLGHIASGRTKSCGCLSRAKTVERSTKHGEKAGRPPSTEYMTWQAMLSRCTNIANKNFKDYGGRGIAVCDRWRSFDNFLADMGRKPSSQHSIDRIDNCKNYEPGNCRWATRKDQSRNQRSNVVIEIDGISATISEWAERAGVKAAMIAARIRRGWPHRDAVIRPKGFRRLLAAIGGE